MTHDEWVTASLTRIGGEVKRARLAAGLRQDQLAEAVNITRNALQNLESPKGRRTTLDVLTLMLIARRLGIPPVELIYPTLPDGEVEVWPGVETTSLQAMQWFSGDIPAKDILDDETTANSNHRRAGLSRARERAKERLSSARTALLESQLVPHSSPFTPGQAQLMIDHIQRELADLEDTMRREGMVINDA